jgi:hypothetical protein
MSMRGLAAAAIVLAWAGAAHAQANPAFTRDLVFKTQDLVFSVQPVAGAAQSVQGQTQTLQVKETPTETRIELAADVLFDFDKAVLLPKAQDTLSACSSRRRGGAGRCASKATPTPRAATPTIRSSPTAAPYRSSNGSSRMRGSAA